MNLKISALEYVEEVKTGNITVEEFTAKTIERINLVDDKQIVEITSVVAAFNWANIIADALGTDMEA